MSQKRGRPPAQSQRPTAFRIVCSSNHRQRTLLEVDAAGGAVALGGKLFEHWTERTAARVAMLPNESASSPGEWVLGRRTWTLQCPRCALKVDRREESFGLLLAGLAASGRVEVELSELAAIVETNYL